MNNANRRGSAPYNAAVVALTGYEKISGKAPNGLPIELWQLPGASTAAIQKAIMKDVGAAVVFAEKTFGVLPSMPHGTLRYVQALSDNFSMEHDGLIAMAPSMLADPREAANVAVHEFFHHFFGNDQRVKDWDFWMNEGFADYFEYRMIEARDGVEAGKRRFDYAADRANRAMSTNSHSLAGVKGTDVLTVFDQIPYQYGPWVLRMMEMKL